MRVPLAIALLAGVGCTSPDDPPAGPDAGLDGEIGSDAGADAADPDAPMEDGGTPAWAEWLDARAQVLCAVEVRCESWDRSYDVYGRGPFDCHPRHRPDTEALASSLDAGSITFDPVAAARCLEELAALPCHQVYANGPRPNEPLVCHHVIAGSRPAGARCDEGPSAFRWTDVCARGLECDYDYRACEGTCVPVAGLGEPCVDRPCERGLACRFDVCTDEPGPGWPCGTSSTCPRSLDQYCIDGHCQVATGAGLGEDCSQRTCATDLGCNVDRCVVQPDVGAPCDREIGCRTGAVCSSGTCIAMPREGEPCATNVGTHERRCPPEAPYCVLPEDDRAVCSRSPLGERCTIEWSGPYLESCWEHGPETVTCTPRTWTPDSPEIGGGYCVLRAGIGEPCARELGCGESARCVEGTCRAIAMPDEPCGSDVVCPWTHGCVGGRCIARPWLGEPCRELPCMIGGCSAASICELVDHDRPCVRDGVGAPLVACAIGRCDGYCRESEPTCDHPAQCAPGTRCLMGPSSSGSPTCRRECR